MLLEVMGWDDGHDDDDNDFDDDDNNDDDGMMIVVKMMMMMVAVGLRLKNSMFPNQRLLIKILLKNMFLFS